MHDESVVVLLTYGSVTSNGPPWDRPSLKSVSALGPMLSIENGRGNVREEVKALRNVGVVREEARVTGDVTGKSVQKANGELFG